MEHKSWNILDLEQAARTQQRVTDADLSGMDLRGADLDGLHLDHCNLANADMRGVNLSDAVIRNCDLSGIEAVDICLADSLLEQCDFSDARFGGSIVVRTRFVSCRFSGVTALMVDWHSAAAMDYLTFHDKSGRAIELSAPFLVAQGRGVHLAVIGNRVIRDGIIMDGLGDGRPLSDLLKSWLRLTESGEEHFSALKN